MGYVAGKLKQVQRAGKIVHLKPGDPVPEAASWKNLDAWVAQKMVVHVPDGSEKKAAKAPVTEAPEPDTLEDEETPTKKAAKAAKKRR